MLAPHLQRSISPDLVPGVHLQHSIPPCLRVCASPDLSAFGTSVSPRLQRLSCCALIFLRICPAVPVLFYALTLLCPIFLRTSPAVPLFLFCCALTLLCRYFSTHYYADVLLFFCALTLRACDGHMYQMYVGRQGCVCEFRC